MQHANYTKVIEWYWQAIQGACELYRLNETKQNKCNVIQKMRNWIKAKQSEDIINYLISSNIQFTIINGRICL
jgi:hypothetical protein